jgi:hypothetical protein
MLIRMLGYTLYTAEKYAPIYNDRNQVKGLPAKKAIRVSLSGSVCEPANELEGVKVAVGP